MDQSIPNFQLAVDICASKEMPGSQHWAHGPGPKYPAGWEACTKIFKEWQKVQSYQLQGRQNDVKLTPEDQQRAVVDRAGGRLP